MPCVSQEGLWSSELLSPLLEDVEAQGGLPPHEHGLAIEMGGGETCLLHDWDPTLPVSRVASVEELIQVSQLEWISVYELDAWATRQRSPHQAHTTQGLVSTGLIRRAFCASSGAG